MRRATWAVVVLLGGCDEPKAKLTPAEVRRDVAQQNTRGDQRMRATGDDAAVLEVAGRDSCTREVLVDIVQRTGPALVGVGFRTLKCMDSSVEVSLGSPLPTARPAEVVDVTLPILFGDYGTNSIAADAKYKGKVLRVTAIVGRVGRDALDEPFVALHVGGKPDGFIARFRTDAGLAELKPMKELVMRCLGGTEFGKVTLTDCVLE